MTLIFRANILTKNLRNFQIILPLKCILLIKWHKYCTTAINWHWILFCFFMFDMVLFFIFYFLFLFLVLSTLIIFPSISPWENIVMEKTFAMNFKSSKDKRNIDWNQMSSSNSIDNISSQTHLIQYALCPALYTEPGWLTLRHGQINWKAICKSKPSPFLKVNYMVMMVATKRPGGGYSYLVWTGVCR